MRLFANKEKEEAKAGKGIIRQDVQMDLSNKIKGKLEKLNQNILEMNYIADDTNVAINAVGNSIDIINDGNTELTLRTKEMNQITVKIGDIIEKTGGYVKDLDETARNMLESNEEVIGIFHELIEVLLCSASALISPATTEKPLPASPALAASMDAFRLRRLVLLAMLFIMSIACCISFVALLVSIVLIAISLMQFSVAIKKQTESLGKTDAMMEQTNRLIQDVAEKVRQIDANSKELEEGKDVIIENMGSLEKLSESNCSATENIVVRFKNIVGNALGIGEKSLAVSDVYDEMDRVCNGYAGNGKKKKEEREEIHVAYMPNYGSLCAIVPDCLAGRIFYIPHSFPPQIGNRPYFMPPVSDNSLRIG
mgnify:CR=1 FL=1